MRKCFFCGRDVPDDAHVCEHCQNKLPAETVALGMPLCFDHTCEGCGETTTVYDRRYWQTVACSECGKEFLANPPMSDEV